MQTQLGLNAATGGMMATFNYAGYLSAILIVTMVGDPALRLWLYRAGLVAGLVGTLGMGLTTSPALWMALRFLGGLGAAAGMLLGAGMVLSWLIAEGRRPQLGLHFIGMGLGITISGLFVMATASWLTWAEQWIAMGIFGAALLVPAWIWLPSPPATPAPPVAKKARGVVKSRTRPLQFLALAYCGAGVGYVVSATFLVVVTESHPALAGKGTLVWIIAGIAATPATLVWDRVVRRIGDVSALLCAYGLQILSLLLSLLPSLAAAIAGAVLFGMTFIGIVSMTLALAGRLTPAAPSRAMAQMTLSYGIAQVTAPVIVGLAADKGGGYATGLWMAVVAMAVGVVFLLAYHRGVRRA
ncbi:YbfB/YjiJ family MFS transporter [Falsirhodobacter halotolerans]|nr:YbfB/YjiJ family MFS transporter [Falsirhodobacter halotolerans]